MTDAYSCDLIWVQLYFFGSQEKETKYPEKKFLHFLVSSPKDVYVDDTPLR